MNAKEKAINWLNKNIDTMFVVGKQEKKVYDKVTWEINNKTLNKILDIAIQEAKKELIKDLKKNFPKTLQPLGTKKETMIPKWKAIKAIGLLIDELEKRHLSTFDKSKGTELSSSGSPDGSPKDSGFFEKAGRELDEERERREELEECQNPSDD